MLVRDICWFAKPTKGSITYGTLHFITTCFFLYIYLFIFYKKNLIYWIYIKTRYFLHFDGTIRTKWYFLFFYSLFKIMLEPFITCNPYINKYINSIFGKSKYTFMPVISTIEAHFVSTFTSDFTLLIILLDDFIAPLFITPFQ